VWGVQAIAAATAAAKAGATKGAKAEAAKGTKAEAAKGAESAKEAETTTKATTPGVANFKSGDEVDVEVNGKYFLARIVNRVRQCAGPFGRGGLKFNVQYLKSNHAAECVEGTRPKKVCCAGVVAQQAVGPNPKLDNGGIKKKRKRPKHTHQTVEPSSSWVKVSSAGGVVVVNWFCDTCKQWNMGAQVETKGGCKNPKKQCGSCNKRKQVRVPKHIFDSE